MKEIIIKGKLKAIYNLSFELYRIYVYSKIGIVIGDYNPLSKGFWFDADAVCVDEFQDFLKFIDSENLSFNQEK